MYNYVKQYQVLIKQYWLLIPRVVLTSDHDDTDSSSSAELNWATDLLTRGIQHTHTANKGQVSLRREFREGSFMSNLIKFLH